MWIAASIGIDNGRYGLNQIAAVAPATRKHYSTCVVPLQEKNTGSQRAIATLTSNHRSLIAAKRSPTPAPCRSASPL
jgi:hypothetical protein